MKKYRDMGERLLANSFVDERGCWLWLGNIHHKGYGRLNVRVQGKHKSVYAHVASYEYFKGKKIPLGMQAHHKCTVCRCIHPDHLEPLDPNDNNAEMWARRMLAKPPENR